MKTEKSLTTLITLAVREKGGGKAKMSIFILLVQSKQHGVLGLGHDRALVWVNGYKPLILNTYEILE